MTPSPAEKYSIVTLATGDTSIRSLEYDETFHPVVGPTAEAQALYVEQLQLTQRMSYCQGDFVIWDIGLGGAANALTVLKQTREVKTRLKLISFDQTLEPLQFGLANNNRLNYFDGYLEPIQRLIEYQHVVFNNGNQHVEWNLILGDFPRVIGQLAAPPQSDSPRSVQPKPHAVLYDAYSPAKNPSMWTRPIFQDLWSVMEGDRPCALATYSRSTMLRVTLLISGFYVGWGNATGGKEQTTIAANHLALIARPLDKRWLQRAKHSTSAEPLESAYRQAPLREETWKRLIQHDQFRVKN